MLRKVIHGGFVFGVAFVLMGPFSHFMVGQPGWQHAAGLGLGWGLALGLIVGMGSDISTGVGMVLGLGAGAGVYWGPFDGVIIGFVAAIPAAMGVGLVSVLLDWSLGAGLFWGLSLGISACIACVAGGRMGGILGRRGGVHYRPRRAGRAEAVVGPPGINRNLAISRNPYCGARSR